MVGEVAGGVMVLERACSGGKDSVSTGCGRVLERWWVGVRGFGPLDAMEGSSCENEGTM